MAYFNYHQHNSNGRWDYDLPAIIVVQAATATEANNKFNEVVSKEKQDQDNCPCCGDRWSPCEAADAFEDQELDDIVENMPEGEEVFKSGVILNGYPYTGLEDYWVIRSFK
jgi:hypothetical protein